MKNYIINVNGNTYNVTVEEGNNISAIEKREVKESLPKANITTPKASNNEGGIKVVAPMAGKILEVKTAIGKAVKKGEVLVILEAMKMENEIVAPADGTVVSINVTSGEAVEISKVLVTLN